MNFILETFKNAEVLLNSLLAQLFQKQISHVTVKFLFLFTS